MCLTDKQALPQGFSNDARWLATTPENKINCMRVNPEDSSSPFDIQRLGLLTAGAHTTFFKEIFVDAFGEQGLAKHAEFAEQVSMPKGDDLMSEEQFAELKEWFTHFKPYQPYLEELLGAPTEIPRECVAWQSEDLGLYLEARKADNWSVRNLEAGIKMFGCPSDGFDPLVCFRDRFENGELYPQLASTEWGKSWNATFSDQKLRVLYELPFTTSFWMRSSANGRFVANGLSKNGQTNSSVIRSSDGSRSDRDDALTGQPMHGMITDLWASKTSGALRTNIRVKASYDPTFFPDNSGFLFQGAGNGFCQQSVLLDPNIDEIDFTQPGCSVSNQVQLYQSVGASLEGTDYFAITGAFVSEYRTGVVGEPEWLKKSYLDVNPILFDGDKFEAQPATRVWSPFLGDYGLSPSTNLTIARVAGLSESNDFTQLGYDISRLNKQEESDGTVSVSLTPMARLCQGGAKANFSFDERFVVTHRAVRQQDFAEFGYDSADNADFKALIGSHNIYLMDLLTGTSHRLTTVGSNQHAKFPHFRSDGWIYFLAMVDDHSYVVTTDAALLIGRKVH
jgi:hypothetical protein